MCVSLGSFHEFIPATFMYTTFLLLPMSISVSKNRGLSDVHGDFADDRLTPRELGSSFDISWRRDTIDEVVLLIWFGGNAACVALYWRGLASTPVWRIPRNPGIPWGPSLKTLKEFVWLVAEHMSYSRFSSVPPPVAGPHLAPLALLPAASGVRGRSPAVQSDSAASSAKAWWS